VNLQTRQIIDVLADRKADTAATWMATHPEIQAGRVAIVELIMPRLQRQEPLKRSSARIASIS
jgi:hypothetical protein